MRICKCGSRAFEVIPIGKFADNTRDDELKCLFCGFQDKERNFRKEIPKETLEKISSAIAEQIENSLFML